MQLNLTIIMGYLEKELIVSSNPGSRYQYALDQASIYTAGAHLQENTLYILYASSLCALPAHKDTCFLIIQDDSSFMPDESDKYLYLKNTYSAEQYLIQVLQIFQKMNNWNARLNNAMLEGKSLQEIGECALELFDNPVMLAGVAGSNLFHAYHKDMPFPSNYYFFSPFETADEREIIVLNEDYQNCITQEYPTIFPKDMYGYRTLAQNIYDNGQRVAQLLIDELKRPLRPEDYSLMYYFAQVIPWVLHRDHLNPQIFSRELDSLIQRMILAKKPFTRQDQAILDTVPRLNAAYFQCLYLTLKPDGEDSVRIENFVVYLYSFFANAYISPIENGLLIINTYHHDVDRPNLGNSFDFFLTHNHFCIGISGVFEHFTDLRIYYTQARTAMNIGSRLHPEKNQYYYREYILDIMLANCTAGLPVDFYYTDQIRKLLIYDRKNNTELFETLKIYILNHRSITRTLTYLTVHRTTLLYRIKRIEEISGMNLKDEKVYLYLLLLMHLQE